MEWLPWGIYPQIFMKMVGRTQDPYLSKRIQQPTSILFKMYQEKKKNMVG